jgi:hypothetical protein
VPDIFRGYAVGIVDGASPRDSDCYLDTDLLAKKTTMVIKSFLGFSLKNPIEPLRYSNQLMVDLSNQMQSCSTVVLIKQFNTRTSQWSGVFNFVFSTYYDFVNYGSARASFDDIMYRKNITCEEIGINVGNIVSTTFEYKAPMHDPIR